MEKIILCALGLIALLILARPIIALVIHFFGLIAILAMIVAATATIIARIRG